MKMKTEDYIDGEFWKRSIEPLSGEGERLPFLYCSECGMMYDATKAPRVCEVNGAGAELTPVYAVYSAER